MKTDISCFISRCNKILKEYTGDKLKNVITTITLIVWFDLLGKAGKMSGIPRTMQDNELREFSTEILDYLKTIDKALDISLIEKTLFPININVYTGEIRG